MKSTALITAALLLAPLSAGVAAAQSDLLEPVLSCRQITDDAERLACFDTSVGALSGEDLSGTIVVVRRERIEEAERESFGLRVPSVSALANSISGVFSNDPGARASGSEPHHAAQAPADAAAPQADAAAEPSVPDSPSAEAQLAERTGVEVIERNDDGTATVVIMPIERAREFGYQRFRFYMANGQVWEQTETTRLRMPRNGEALAYIRRLPLGGYVLRINDRGSASDVRRVR